MDSPHLLHLGFLLLALAAPHPSIAMSTGGSARSTQGSTTMTVYRCCKDCESCKREDGRIDLENFAIIAEIQNKTNTIPGVTVEFVATDSHMTVCFEQANFCPEEIYGIFDKTEPPKFWCGILNTGENGGGDINTEDKTVCCEGEADPWQNPDLKCYIQKSHPKHTIPPVAIPGNPEFLTSKKSSLGVLLAFLFVGVCTGWGTMFYFLRLRRRQAPRQDREALTEKSSHSLDDHL